jgi:hypothetical protein
MRIWIIPCTVWRYGVICAESRALISAEQEWLGNHFVRTSLHALNLVLQLGHRRGEPCLLPAKGSSDFTVIHTNGIHRVTVMFCQCRPDATHVQQLLRQRLFPATVRDPQTCATFDVLRNWQKMSEGGDINATDYYRALENLTDARRLLRLPVRQRKCWRCASDVFRRIVDGPLPS